MRMIILAGSLLLTLGAPAMAETIYRWVDSEGVTHFSAQPPQGRQADSLRLAVQPPPLQSTASEQGTERAGEREQREIERKVKREIAGQQAQHQHYCTTLRTQLVQLQNNPRVRVEEGGQLRRLGEEERQMRIADTSKKLASDCD